MLTTADRLSYLRAAGTVDAAPAGSGLAPGQKVVAMMGDMGRTYDGGYADDRATGKLVVRVRH